VQGFTGRVVTNAGKPVPQASITVTISGGGAATIYSDNATPPTALANPFNADDDGVFTFYAENGVYDITGPFGIVRNGVPLYDVTNAVTVFIRKTADETLNNDNTFQNDDELYFDVQTGEVWYVLFALKITTGAVPKFRARLSGPTVASTRQHMQTWDDNVLNAAYTSNNAVGFSTNAPTTGASTNGWYYMDNYFIVSTGATLYVQWAQSVANASDTTVSAGSYLSARRLT
jgi:hypothetical protein